MHEVHLLEEGKPQDGVIFLVSPQRSTRGQVSFFRHQKGKSTISLRAGHSRLVYLSLRRRLLTVCCFSFWMGSFTPVVHTDNGRICPRTLAPKDSCPIVLGRLYCGAFFAWIGFQLGILRKETEGNWKLVAANWSFPSSFQGRMDGIFSSDPSWCRDRQPRIEGPRRRWIVGKGSKTCSKTVSKSTHGPTVGLTARVGEFMWGLCLTHV